MADGYIRLALGSFTVDCVEFNATTDFPRSAGEFPSPTYTATRNLVAPGNPGRQLEKWSFEAILQKPDALNLEGLYREHRRLVDNRQSSSWVVLTDTTKEFCELGSSPTHNQADAPFNTTSTSGGYVYYYARFLTYFSTPLEIRYWGSDISGNPYWICTCNLVEAGEVFGP